MKPEEAFNQFYVWGDSGWSKSETPNSDSLVLAIQALEKQIPKKPIIKGRKYWFVCGACDEEVDSDYEYCPDCGQRIEWSESE